MEALRLMRWRVSVVAALAMLLHALMPVLMPARAAAGSAPSGWSEVCTGGKVQRVAATSLDGDDATTGVGKPNITSAHMDDCSSCTQHGNAGATNDGHRAPSIVSGRPILFERAIGVRDPRLAWATAHTRSPPSLI